MGRVAFIATWQGFKKLSTQEMEPFNSSRPPQEEDDPSTDQTEEPSLIFFSFLVIHHVRIAIECRTLLHYARPTGDQSMTTNEKRRRRQRNDERKTPTKPTYRPGLERPGHMTLSGPPARREGRKQGKGYTQIEERGETKIRINVGKKIRKDRANQEDLLLR